MRIDGLFCYYIQPIKKLGGTGNGHREARLFETSDFLWAFLLEVSVMAYKTIKDMVASENYDVAQESYNKRLWVLNSFLDVIGCALSVARHAKNINNLEDVQLHPMHKCVGGRTDKLLDSTIETLAWVQEVMFDDRKESEDQTKQRPMEKNR